MRLPPTPDPRELTRLKVSGPGDLLAVVPYLLSFHPRESLVAVYVARGRVVVTARLDLPSAVDVPELATEITQLGRQQQADNVVVIAYSDHADHARAVLTGLIDRLSPSLVSDAMYVDGQHWWSLTCKDRCCPPEGLPYQADTHPLAAQAVFAGLGVRADRSELGTLVAGPEPGQVARLSARAADLEVELGRLSPEAAERLLDAAVQESLEVRAQPDTDLALQLAVLASTQVVLRDRAWAMMDRATAQQHVQLWSDVVAVAPPGQMAAPICLLGMAAWINGDGALLNCCLDRIAEVDPTYTMGRLLAQVSAKAVNPQCWEEWVEEMRDGLGLRTRESGLV